MKAKEYAQEIIDNNYSMDAFDKMGRALLDEVSELIKSRKCQTTSSINAAFKDIDQKYRAICRILNKEKEIITERGFQILVTRLYSLSPTLRELDYIQKGMLYIVEGELPRGLKQ